MSDALTEVDFWFDPVCPWAWITSRWLLEVEKVRPIAARWHIMSLAILNQDKDVSDDYRKAMARAWGPVRVCMAAAKREGRRGPAAHVHGDRDPFPQRGSTRASGACRGTGRGGAVRTGLLAAADSTEFDEAIAKSHHEGMALVGEDVGTPVIRVGAAAIFGPVGVSDPAGRSGRRAL